MSELAYFRKILRKRERETECKTQNAALVAKKRKKGKRESFVLSWRDGPFTKRKEKRGKRKDAFASSSSKKKTKKTKKCAHLLLLLWRRHRLHHRRRLFILLPCITPRAPPSRLKHPRVLSLLSLLPIARASFFSLSRSRKRKKNRPRGEERRN